MTEKKNFWQTIPGLVTGLATIITALFSLMQVLSGGDGKPEPQASDSPSPTPTATSTSRPTGSGPANSTKDSAPEAVVAPKGLDFGRLGTGKTAEQKVTVANTGTEYLVIEKAAITGRTEVFTADPGSCLEETGIEPGSECEITVTFAPTSPGSYAGILEIEHSAKHSPTSVALNAEGVLLQL